MHYRNAVGLVTLLAILLATPYCHAAVLAEAETGIRIPLASLPTSRPMTVAYVPLCQKYYVADGGLGPIPGQEISTSRSQVHVFDASGAHVQSANPGYDNRSLYYNSSTRQLETVTYNVSSGAGFTPSTGIFSLTLDEEGKLTGASRDVFGFNPAFGDAGTMPTFDADSQRYYAKQERSNRIWVVDLKSREKVGEILLDLPAAGALHDDISDHFVAFTGMPGEELAVLDVDHKAILVFDLSGHFVGQSRLPAALKLRSQNHFNGLGYANGMLFVYHEREGEFGTYYGFRFLDTQPPAHK